MVSRLRIAVMWLLLFAIPTQGFAAAGMLFCGSHHRSMTLAPVTLSAHDHHGTAADAQDVSHIETAAHSHTAGSNHDLTQGSMGKCSACAVCCMGMALPTATIHMGTTALAEVALTELTLSRAGFFTGGPERPPRTSFV